MTKEQIRKTMKEQRNNLSREERSRRNSELTKRLFHSVRYQDCESIFTYVSFGTEADTHAIILQSLKDNKKVYVPRVNKEDMEFYQIQSIQGLVPSKFGVPEPKEEEAKKYKIDCGTGHRRVMLLPGLAFDLQGSRIGYGAGYYDKYLTRFPKGHFYKIALAYDFQVMNQIASKDHDQRVDLILTPARSIDCSRREGREAHELS